MLSVLLCSHFEGLRFGGPVSKESLVEHLDSFPVAILERLSQLTLQPIWHSAHLVSERHST